MKKTALSVAVISSAFAMILLLASCDTPIDLGGAGGDGNGDGSGGAAGTAAVTGVSLGKAALELETGASGTLIATVSPSDAKTKTVSWTSSSASVAKVDSNGKITPLTAGKSTITVKTADGSFTATCVVTVTISTQTVQSALGLFAAKLAATRTEFAKIKTVVDSFSGKVGTAKTTMSVLKGIDDGILAIDKRLNTVETVAKAAGVLPVVGSAVSSAGTVAGTARKIIAPIAAKVKVVHEPYVVPANDLVKKLKMTTDTIKADLLLLDTCLAFADTLADKADAKLSEGQNAAAREKINTDVAKLGAYLDALNKVLAAINGVPSATASTLTAIGGAASALDTISDGVDIFNAPLEKIGGALDKIEAALNKEFTINLVFKEYTFTVREVLDSSVGAVEKAAKAILEPVFNAVLDALNVSLPSIPGIDKLNAVADSAKGYFDAFTSACGKMESAAADTGKIDTDMASGLNSWAATMGVSVPSGMQ